VVVVQGSGMELCSMKAVKMTASLLEGLGGRVSHEVTLE
jgi:hypothetical protein